MLSITRLTCLALVLCAGLAPTAALAQTRRVWPVTFSVGGGWQSASPDFSDRLTEPLYVEQATFDERYRPRADTLFDVGGGVRVWRGLWAGVAFTRSSQSHGVAIDGSLPHPFHFGAARTITGTRDGLARKQSAVHLQVIWRLPVTPRLDVSVAVGPSWWTLDQDLVNGIDFDEAYPYDVATFTAARVARASGSRTTFHVGGDVTYRIWRQIGAGVQVRYSRVRVDLPGQGGGSPSTDVGGTQTTVGLRVTY